MIDELVKLIKGKDIKDIVLAGFIDYEDGVAHFYPDLRFMYFEIDLKFIEFESIEQYSKLRVRLVDSIKFRFEIDEDMCKGKSSVSEIVLNQDGAIGNCISLIKVYNLVEAEDELICDAIEISLKNGQTLFLDPSFYFGINIGGNEQKEIWKENLSQSVYVTETLIQV